MYPALGIPRDVEQKDDIISRNLDCYGAPHLILLFFPSTGDNVRMGADIGQYAQTVMLSLESHGLGSVPQTAMGIFAEPIREFLKIADNMKLLFGISFGFEDKDDAANKFRMGRDPLESTVVFYD